MSMNLYTKLIVGVKIEEMNNGYPREELILDSPYHNRIYFTLHGQQHEDIEDDCLYGVDICEIDRIPIEEILEKYK